MLGDSLYLLRGLCVEVIRATVLGDSLCLVRGLCVEHLLHQTSGQLGRSGDVVLLQRRRAVQSEKKEAGGRGRAEKDMVMWVVMWDGRQSM